ncbi:PA14 domain-containing protein, partial [Ruegeria conchae]
MSSIDIRNFGIPTQGLGFVAEYYVLPNWVSSLSEIDFDRSPDAVEIATELDAVWSYDAFWDGGPQDSFAARYTGSLNVIEDGVYTIHLTSDDGSALYVDGELVINNDGNHGAKLVPVSLELSSGAHEIEVRYFESGGAQTLKLEWSGPDTDNELQLIDSSVVNYSLPADTDAANEGTDSVAASAEAAPDTVAEATTNPGLEAKFVKINRGDKTLDQINFDADPIAEQILTEVNYEKSRKAWWEDGPRSRFAAEITGQLNVEMAGEYTIYLESDDGSALSLDGVQIIDNDGRHGTTEIHETLFLTAGSHDLELLYFEYSGAQTLRLLWSGPDTDGAKVPISGNSLSHGEPAAAPVADQDNTDQGGHD